MTLQGLAARRAHVAQGQLDRCPDPLALYRVLSDEGQRPDTGLFESPDGRTVLMAAAAVRAECRRSAVSMEAISRNGRALLEAVALQAPELVASREVDCLELLFPQERSADCDERLRSPAPIDVIRLLLRASGARRTDEPFAGLALGVIAFDYAATQEDVPPNAENPFDFPDYLFWIPESLVLFERSSSARLICTAFASPSGPSAERGMNDAVERLRALAAACDRAVEPHPNSFSVEAAADVQPDVDVDMDDDQFIALVRRLKDEIAAGEVYQIVPSRTFRVKCSAPLSAFASLRALEPAAYHFFVRAQGFVLTGASPEASVRVVEEEGGLIVEVWPIAGTRPRGHTADEDDRLEADLRLDPKEVAEHMMLVDLARNDVARVSEAGTRRVARLLSVERHARVMHLVSSVTGKLAPGLDAFHALRACLNVGTLTGAPKLRATQVLAQAERTRRGPYGGAVGWINAAGEMDTSVVIRSALVRNGIAFVRAGAGIVHDSDPVCEANETRHKAAALLSILTAADAESAG